MTAYLCCIFIQKWGGVNIREFPNKYHKELSEASDWLKFGFHSIEAQFRQSQTDSFDLFVQAFNAVDRSVERFASSQSKARALRLHYYYANREMLSYLHAQGIKTMLTADDNRCSYSLSDRENRLLQQGNQLVKDSLRFIPTNLRLERIKVPFIDMYKITTDTIVLFTHEWKLNRINRMKMEYILWYYYHSSSKYIFL